MYLTEYSLTGSMELLFNNFLYTDTVTHLGHIRNFIKVYSNDDMVCADFIRDVRLGRISFNSREDTSMIINSICCD